MYQGVVECFVSTLYVFVEILQVIFLFIYDTLYMQCHVVCFALEAAQQLKALLASILH